MTLRDDVKSGDLPRHREYMGFAKDWPRMNTLPEWFTVEPDATYTVHRGEEPPRACTGRQLHAGLEVAVKAGQWLRVEVQPGNP